MGYIMQYLKRKHGDKWWIWAIDWTVELAMLAGFIYLSWYVRVYMLQRTDYSKCLVWKNQTLNVNLTTGGFNVSIS
jgi:hypothetical protein